MLFDAISKSVSAIPFIIRTSLASGGSWGDPPKQCNGPTDVHGGELDFASRFQYTMFTIKPKKFIVE